MSSIANIFLITEDTNTVSLIKTIFKKNKGLSLTDVYQRMSNAESVLPDNQPCVLIVDIDKDPDDVLSKLVSIADRYPEKRIVVVSSSLNQDLILRSMQAGARQFLVKDTLEEEMPGVLSHLIPQSQEVAKELGSVISIFSSSGGCGATTIAVNLANELRLTTPEPLLVVDLDSCYGSIAAYLGVSGPTSIRDLLEYDGKIDIHLIESCSYNYIDNFNILANPSGFETPQTVFLRYDKVLNTVRISRESYKYIIVDAPRLESSLRKGLAKISDLVLIVFQGTVKDMNYARSMIASFLKAGVEREKIVLMANRYKKRALPMKLDEIQKVLGVDRIISVRSDWKRTALSINNGKPLSEIAPWSGLRKDFQKIASLVSSQTRNGSSGF
ncbi:MAG: AAA family ATPase [Planctomycetota bacterium]|jgi:pilus assembly protein CpaE